MCSRRYAPKIQFSNKAWTASCIILCLTRRWCLRAVKRFKLKHASDVVPNAVKWSAALHEHTRTHRLGCLGWAQWAGRNRLCISALHPGRWHLASGRGRSSCRPCCTVHSAHARTPRTIHPADPTHPVSTAGSHRGQSPRTRTCPGRPELAGHLPDQPGVSFLSNGQCKLAGLGQYMCVCAYMYVYTCT